MCTINGSLGRYAHGGIWDLGGKYWGEMGGFRGLLRMSPVPDVRNEGENNAGIFDWVYGVIARSSVAMNLVNGF